MGVIFCPPGGLPACAGAWRGSEEPRVVCRLLCKPLLQGLEKVNISGLIQASSAKDFHIFKALGGGLQSILQNPPPRVPNAPQAPAQAGRCPGEAKSPPIPLQQSDLDFRLHPESRAVDGKESRGERTSVCEHSEAERRLWKPQGEHSLVCPLLCRKSSSPGGRL